MHIYIYVCVCLYVYVYMSKYVYIAEKAKNLFKKWNFFTVWPAGFHRHENSIYVIEIVVFYYGLYDKRLRTFSSFVQTPDKAALKNKQH